LRIRTLATELWLPGRIGAVFDFFSAASNLDPLTPPWLHFRILTPGPLTLGPGTLIEYRIRWRGLPLRWLTEISAWEPPHRFVDRQLRGPYRCWVHEHTFAERDGGTLVRDTVTYALAGWLLEPLVQRWLVGPDLARIFAYRRARLQERFGRDLDWAPGSRYPGRNLEQTLNQDPV
jgi:ligand-binding SRPBCC domain-containing protein